MGRKSSTQLWLHWASSSSGNNHYSSVYCNYTIVKHAGRCKDHTGRCTKAPQQVRDRFKEIPNAGSTSEILTDANGRKPENESTALTPVDVGAFSVGNLLENTTRPLDGHGVSTEEAANLPLSSITGATVSSSSAAKKLKLGTLDGQVNRLTQGKLRELQSLFVKAMIAGNVPFNWLQNHHLRQYFEKLGSGFTPPSRKEASGSILESTEVDIKLKVKSIIENEVYVTLIPDGWQNVRGTAVINIMVGNPNICTYYKSFETGEVSQNTIYIKSKLSEVIDALHKRPNLPDLDKVVGIISEQGSAYKQARNEIQTDTGGKILSITCSAHLLNLVAGDVCKLPPIQHVVNLAKSIVKEVKASKLKIGEYNKEFEKYILEQKEHGQRAIKISLTLPATTRWYGIRDMFEKLMRARPVLERMAINKDGRMSNGWRGTIKDDTFWSKIEKVHPLICDITDGIRVVESKSATLSDVVKEFSKLADNFVPGGTKYTLLEEILPALELSTAHKIYLQRAADEHITTYHYLSNLLDPRYKGQSFHHNEDAMQQVLNLLEMYASNIGVATTIDAKQKLGCQLSAFRMNEKLFSSAMLYHDVPNLFWKNYLSYESTNLIARIGCRLLSIPASSADIERSFSVQGNVHTKSRNRLTEKTVDKLSHEARQFEIENNKFKSLHQVTNEEKDEYLNDDDDDEGDDIDEIIYLDSPFNLEELQATASNVVAVNPVVDTAANSTGGQSKLWGQL